MIATPVILVDPAGSCLYFMINLPEGLALNIVTAFSVLEGNPVWNTPCILFDQIRDTAHLCDLIQRISLILHLPPLSYLLFLFPFFLDRRIFQQYLHNLHSVSGNYKDTDYCDCNNSDQIQYHSK